MSDVHFVNNGQQNSNSAYVRIKIFKKPIIAKMLVDSGNLVSDLISEEFAKLARVPYEPVQKKVGTAAKGGSVNIIGKCKPFKIFIENVSKAITLQPFIVKELSHPINVGRAFLGRYRGRLEFAPDKGFLEICGQKTKLIDKRDELRGEAVTDERIKKVAELPEGRKYSAPHMVMEGMLNQVEYTPKEDIPVYPRTKLEIPAQSAMFVPITTRGRILVGEIEDRPLLMEEIGEESGASLLIPGICSIIENEAYCFVINPAPTRTILHPEDPIGKATILPEGTWSQRPQIGNASSCAVTGKETRDRRKWIEDKLKLKENEVVRRTPRLKEEILRLFEDNFEALSQHEFDYGHTTAIQCQIQLKKGEEEPVRLKARPLNPAQEASMQNQLQEWESSGVIEKSQSPWAFPMVGVKKKDSAMLRWCVDYRLLNKKMVKDAYPLSSIENNLHKLQGAKYFTTLDSAGAYHNVEIHPESREYTSFITPFGQYQFVRMPFGLSNAGACYSRLMSIALQYLPTQYVLAYLDDIIVFSKTIEEHLEQLRKVLEVHKQFGMKLKVSKCKVLQEEVEYLGHLVSQEGIQMVPSYVQKILDWPLPQTGKQLKQFLGFIGYYRSFIPDVADLTYEMNEMKNGSNLTWNEKVEQKFRDLKTRFREAPLRSYPRYESKEPFILDTDFSKTNLAAILSQVQDGQEKFIGAGARKCNQAEQNYPSHKGELAAAVMGMRKFEHLLRYKPFILRTDSKCMQFLNSLKEVRGIYARWLNFIQGFDFEVVHRPGVKNQNADALSRMEQLPEVPGDSGEEEKLDHEEDVYALETGEVESWMTGDPLERQKQDPVLKEVIRWVEEKKKPDTEKIREAGKEYSAYRSVFERLHLTEKSGLMYRSPEDEEDRFCLPDDCFSKAFTWIHSHPSAGHFGIVATQKKFRKKFFLPGATTRIVSEIMNCINCIQKKNFVKKDQHVFHRTLETHPMGKVYIDLVGPLPEDEYRGQKVTYLLTMMDGFTKWAEAVPIRDISARGVADVLIDQWVSRYGIPDQIHSDQGTQFTSELFQNLMQLLGVTKTTTPAYNPRSNKVERLHRVLGDLLRSDQTGMPHCWVRKLPWALFAYRTTVSNVTGMTPFRALFGTDSKVPLDVIFPGPPQERMQWSDYVQEKQKQLQQTYSFIREHQRLAVQRATSYQSGKVTKATKIEEGDVVYYFAPRVIRQKGAPISRKLALLWTGPYKVVTKVTETLAKISPFGDWAKNGREIITTVDKLRVVRGPIPEAKLRPGEKIDLDEIEEDLEDYGEYIREGNGGLRDEINNEELSGHGGSPLYKGESAAADSKESEDAEKRKMEEVKSRMGEIEARDREGILDPGGVREMGGEIGVQCPGQVLLSSAPISHGGQTGPGPEGPLDPVETDTEQRQESAIPSTSDNSSANHSDRPASEDKERNSSEGQPWTRSRSKRNAGILAESLLRAGASMDRVYQAMKPIVAKKRPLENPSAVRESEKRERVEKEGEMEEGEVCMFEEEEAVAWGQWTRDFEEKRASQERAKIAAEPREQSRTRPEREAAQSREPREDGGVQIVGTVNLNHRLPKRVEERPVKRDHKDRPNIPILVGEAKLIKEKLDKGAKVVKKIIVFRATDDGPLIDAHAYIREEARGDDSDTSSEVMKHAKRLPCSYGDKVRLVEKAQEIKELTEEMGAERGDEVREVVDRVVGWPSAKFNRVRSERLAEEKLQLSAKLVVAEEKLQKSEEARVACLAECGYTKSDVEELRKEASRNRTTIEELTRLLAETRAQNYALRKENAKHVLPEPVKKEKGVQVETGRWSLGGKVKRTTGTQVEPAELADPKEENDRAPVALFQPGSTLVAGVKVPSGSPAASGRGDGSAGASTEGREDGEAVWRSILQLQEKVNQLEKWRQLGGKVDEERDAKDGKICVRSNEGERADSPANGPQKVDVAAHDGLVENRVTTDLIERSPKKVGATGAVNLNKPLLPLGVDGPEDKSPRVCVIRAQGVEVDRWREKTGGQEIRFQISHTLASCGVETGRQAPYKRRDGSYEWQLRWTPVWRGGQLVTWGTFTRLIGELEGPVSTNGRVVIIRAYLQDGWKKEGRPALQE
jgi:transposase InsO family protein